MRELIDYFLNFIKALFLSFIIVYMFYKFTTLSPGDGVTVAPSLKSGTALWHHQHHQQWISFSPRAQVCRLSQTQKVCSVQTGRSTPQHALSTAQCDPQRPQTLWCSRPAAPGSSPAACPGWWSDSPSDRALPSSPTSNSQVPNFGEKKKSWSSVHCPPLFECLRKRRPFPWKESTSLSCRRSLACAVRRRPIRNAEVLFPGMFGDVAMHWHPSVEINQKIKKQDHLPRKHTHRWVYYQCVYKTRPSFGCNWIAVMRGRDGTTRI